MQQAQLKVVSRDPKVSGQIQKLRGQGLVPANIYGPGLKNQSCAFSEKELRKTFNNDLGSNIVLNLESDSKELNGKKVVLKVVERHPSTWQVIHADLYEIQMDRPLTTSVALHYTGTPDGVKNDGGIFQVVRRSVKIRALPSDIPAFVEVDTSALKLGESLHLSEVKISDKITVLDSKEFAICSVVEPEKEEVVAPVAAAPGAEGAAAGTGIAAAAGTAAAGGDAAAAPAGGDKAKK